jgi:hypothetical protein
VAWRGGEGEVREGEGRGVQNSSHQLIYFFKQSTILFKETSGVDKMI